MRSKPLGHLRGGGHPAGGIMSGAILHEGRNCWRRVRADRLAFLIDSAAYFEAFVEAARLAETSILIVGWDLDSRLRLLRDGRDHDLPVELGPFLQVLVRRTPSLHVRMLAWVPSPIYLAEREWLTGWRLERSDLDRLELRWDNHHPLLASQHQKLVVIDDRVAFVGGIDLTHQRWDTPAHLPDDPRRLDPEGERFGPLHELMVMVDGQAAASLGGLARQRWRAATGEELEPTFLEPGGWPRQVHPDLMAVEVALARTVPGWGDLAEVREIERLGLDAVAAARRSIYIENQYFTSTIFADALARRLREPDGPEVVVLLPKNGSGWMEQYTMDVLRARVIERLFASDRYGRLRIYHPTTGGDRQEIQVHAKVLIVDDTLLRIGSSNLSNRSMGFDSECDLALEAAGDPRIRGVIGAFRARLLAEHLGSTLDVLLDRIRASGSLIGTIEGLRGGDRSLEPLPPAHQRIRGALVPKLGLIDPDRPLSARMVLERLLGLTPVNPNRIGGRAFSR